MPVYLSVLLLLKALAGVIGLVSPITQGLPVTLPFREVIATSLLIGACFVSGIAVRTGPGLRAKNALERTLLERIPGYSLIRGLAGRIVGKEDEQTFTVVLAEIEDALVPAFLVEDCGDDQCAVFVPSVPRLPPARSTSSPRARAPGRRAIHPGRQCDLEMGCGLERAAGRNEARRTGFRARQRMRGCGRESSRAPRMKSGPWRTPPCEAPGHQRLCE